MLLRFLLLCWSLTRTCIGQLNKYIAINTSSTYNESNLICNELLGTTIASIHSVEDLQEARRSCREQVAGDCWIGLRREKGVSIYEQWEDGSELTFGPDFDQFPWNSNREILHSFTLSQPVCVNLDSESKYLWTEALCTDTMSVLCAAPNAFCDSQTHWESLSGGTIDDIWTFPDCGVIGDAVYEEQSMIDIERQWMITDGLVEMEFVFKMEQINIGKGIAGITLHHHHDDEDEDEDDEGNDKGDGICDYVFIGIEDEWYQSTLIVSEFRNHTEYNKQSIRIEERHESMYRIRVRITNDSKSTHFDITLNGDSNLQFFVSMNGSHVMNADALSIGLRICNLHFDAQSLYISGSPLTVNHSEALFQCTSSSSNVIYSFIDTPTPLAVTADVESTESDSDTDTANDDGNDSDDALTEMKINIGFTYLAEGSSYFRLKETLDDIVDDTVSSPDCSPSIQSEQIQVSFDEQSTLTASVQTTVIDPCLGSQTVVQFLQNVTLSLTDGIKNITEITVITDSVVVNIVPILSMNSNHSILPQHTKSPTPSPLLLIHIEHSHNESVLTLVLLYVTAAVVAAIFCATLLYLTITRTSKHFDEISSLVRDPSHFSKHYEKVRAHSEDPDKGHKAIIIQNDIDIRHQSHHLFDPHEFHDHIPISRSGSECIESVLSAHSMTTTPSIAMIPSQPQSIDVRRPYIVGSSTDENTQELWTKGYINVIANEVHAKEATHSETEEKQFMINQCINTKEDDEDNDDDDEESLDNNHLIGINGEEFAAITTFSGELYPGNSGRDEEQQRGMGMVTTAVSSQSTETISINRLNVEMHLNLENHITGVTGQSSSHLDEQVMAKPEYQHSVKEESRRFISLEDLVMSTQTYSPTLCTKT